MSPQVQEQIALYQNTQQQLQVVSSQKMQIEAKRNEIEQQLKELEKAGEKKVYKSIGMLLVEVDDLDALKKELSELKETYDLRFKTLETQENGLREKFQKLHENLSKTLGPS
jgi:prefoldin beta subunit